VKEHTIPVVILKKFSLYLLTTTPVIIMSMMPVSSWNIAYASSVSQYNVMTALSSNTTPNNYTKIDAINITSCKCVVFRMDDLQDNWIRSAQITGLNLFLSKNIPLSLAIIVNSISNDLQVIAKIKAGINGSNPLFELALHGWDHVDYTKLNEQQQQESLKLANDKMLQLFGNKSNIFITPYGPFNNDTIKAMSNLGIPILSSALVDEERFDHGASIAVAKRHSAAATNNETDHTSNVLLNKTTASLALSLASHRAAGVVYHLPAMSLFFDDESGKPPLKTPIEQILAETKDNIKKYGYSVIVFHPQDFVERDDKGNVIGNGIYQSEVNDLSSLIDSLVHDGIPIVHFSTLLKYIDLNQLYSSSDFNKRTLQCSSGWHVSTYFTPLETDFNGPKKAIMALNQLTNQAKNGTGTTIPIANISSSLSTFTSFLNAVQEYGWGKTKDGNYLGYYNNQYYLAAHPLNSIGKPLRLGDIAVDPSIIPRGAKVTLPTLPSPWDNMTYTASDTGVSISGKHIGVYIGEGKFAQDSDSVKSLNNIVNYSTTTTTTTNHSVELCYF
jgi:peptidoglycan/xylan/chitin deacetylase (PgdA/CDA1 family)/3D (Asp-Asp-Asp) domain-containing protein